MSDQENNDKGGSFLSRVKGAFFEDEHPKPPDKPKDKPVMQSAAVQPAMAPINTGMVNNDDRTNAVRVLSERVFTGNTPYVEYRMTYDALEGTVAPDDNRRKAALAVVSKKCGIQAVAQAITAHKNNLSQEHAVFEQSLSPKQGGPIESYENDVQNKEQSIQAKLSEIESLKREIEDLEQGKKTSQEKITEERAKHEHARSVFEVAYQVLSQGIESDEQLINSQLPKGA